MRVHHLKIILVFVIAFGFLISQGCARIHFTGESREDKERQEKADQPSTKCSYRLKAAEWKGKQSWLITYEWISDEL